MKLFLLFWLVFSTLLLISCYNSEAEVNVLNNKSVRKNIIEEDSLDTLTLIFMGDIMQHSDQIRSAYDHKSGLFDYEPCFRYLRPLFSDNDIVIANLELTLNDKNDYSGYPTFRSPDALASFLKSAGFDVLVTANNHSNDNKKYGLIHTLDVLDSIKLLHTGTFRDSSDREKNYPLIMEKNINGTNFRIALLSYTYGTNGLPTTKPNIVNPIDTILIKEDIEKAKKSNPDMIISYMHWGDEYQLIHNEQQENLAKWLWKNGIDAVIGSHPHVIQPIITDTIFNDDSTESKNVICAYSLGNLISNQFSPRYTDIGLIFELKLVKNKKSSKTKIANHSYLPVWRYIHHQHKSVKQWVHTIIPVSAFESDSLNFLGMPKDKRNSMLDKYKFVQKHLNKFGAIERKLNYLDVVKSGILPPDSVVTILTPLEKPVAPKIRHYEPPKKTTE